MESEHTKQGFLRAGELARAAGVSTDTLRHYERMGALARPRRSTNGYREYPPETLARVRLVRRALAVGFTLAELARLFRVRDRGGAPCREARELAAAKLAQVEEQLEALLSLRDELLATLAGWDARLARTGDGAQAGLLDTLAASVQTTDNGRASLTRRPLKKTERMLDQNDNQ
jgi:DNA-binding transcriptional MerR regulator